MKISISQACVVAATLLLGYSAKSQPILPQLPTSPHAVISTVPPNGDLNPYGVAFVPPGFPTDGPLKPGDILVSNFNDSANLQGTGTTIVQISKGKATVFYHAPHPVGLTTALGILSSGFVVVGNVPTTDGSSGTVHQGSLIIVDRFGNTVNALSNSTFLDGPWDLTVAERGSEAWVFISNVLSGTVTRLTVDVNAQTRKVSVIAVTRIGSGYIHHFDPNALVIGPTGLAYESSSDTLYVASTGNNAIYRLGQAIARHSDGGIGALVYRDHTHLHGPVGLAIAPNGDLITANGDAVNPGGTTNVLVEFTPSGDFVAQYQVHSGPGGGAFGLAFGKLRDQVEFAAVDDINNTVHIWKIEE